MGDLALQAQGSVGWSWMLLIVVVEEGVGWGVIVFELLTEWADYWIVGKLLTGVGIDTGDGVKGNEYWDEEAML